MESKILNFLEAMNLAKFLIDHEIDWMFFDSSLTFQDFIDLSLAQLTEDDFMKLLYIFMGDKCATLPTGEILSGLISGFKDNKIQELLKAYSKNWVK